jgi:hypothetical protein
MINDEASMTVNCKVRISHLGAPLKNKYGLSVERLSGPQLPGADHTQHLANDHALFTCLFEFGYSRPEIGDITLELAPLSSKYVSPERLIEESVLARYGF